MTSGAAGELLFEVDDAGVATLLLNRPEKRNALDRDLVDVLKERLRETARDPAIRVVLLRGAGKDFCAGADLSELERIAQLDVEANRADAHALGELFLLLRDHPRPVIAAVQGRALAGGAGLASGCDLVVAREDALFGYPEVHLGFVPAIVMTILRRKVGEGRAFELALLGERIPAPRAEAIGLVNRVFPQEGWEEGVRDFARGVAALDPEAATRIKSLLYTLDALDFPAGIARGAEVNAEARGTEGALRGIRAFLARSAARRGRPAPGAEG